MKYNWIAVAVMLLISGFIGACSYSKDDALQQDDCATINARFATEVKPIIQATCAANSSCHGMGSVNGPGELITYDQIRTASEAIKAAVESRRMPLGSSLSSAEINKISCWVRSGALNN